MFLHKSLHNGPHINGRGATNIPFEGRHSGRGLGEFSGGDQTTRLGKSREGDITVSISSRERPLCTSASIKGERCKRSEKRFMFHVCEMP